MFKSKEKGSIRPIIIKPRPIEIKNLPKLTCRPSNIKHLEERKINKIISINA